MQAFLQVRERGFRTSLCAHNDDRQAVAAGGRGDGVHASPR